MGDECNCLMVWTFLVLSSWELGWGSTFSSPGHCSVLQICWHIECNTLIASSFRVLNSSTGIPFHPLALLTAVLPKAHLTSHSRMSGCWWLTTTSWLSGLLRSFLYSSSMYSSQLFLIASASTRSLPFLSFTVPIFGQNIPLIFPVFLKRSLVFTLLLFSSIFKHYSLKKAFLFSLLFFGTLRLFGCTFPFLPCFLLLFFLQLFVKPPQITSLPSCFSFSLGWFCLMPSVQYYWTLSIVLQAHCYLDLIPWVYSSPLLHIHRGFKSYLDGLVVFPTFFILSPDFAMRNW